MKGKPVPKVRLNVELDGWSIEREGHFSRWVEGELLSEGYTGVVDVIFVSDERIAELNEQWLQHDGPTDVISFSFNDEDEEPGESATDSGEVFPKDEGFPTGEVYVSLERAVEQAREYGVSVTDEVSRLALHGVLHLAGFDDSDEEQRQAMSRREDEGLKSVKKENGSFHWTVHEPHDGRQ